MTIGDVKPKSTAAEILDKLEKGLYKEWKTDDGDKRCPICLDDVRNLVSPPSAGITSILVH